MLDSGKLVQTLKQYPKDNIDPAIMERFRAEFVSDSNFTPQAVAKAPSVAALLGKWCLAIESYDRASKMAASEKAAQVKPGSELAHSVQMLEAKMTRQRDPSASISETLRHSGGTRMGEGAEFWIKIAAEPGRCLSVAPHRSGEEQEAEEALQHAILALKSLDKGEIRGIKSFAKPPMLVQMAMEAVCTLLGRTPDWDTAKQLLGELDFLNQLLLFDKDSIDPVRIESLQTYLAMEDFTPEAVGKVSKPAKCFCMWTRAIDLYARISGRTNKDSFKVCISDVVETSLEQRWRLVDGDTFQVSLGLS